MSIFTKSITIALTALAIGSVTLAPIAAEASPRHHGGGHHGGGFPGGGYPGPYGGHGHHGGGWGGHGGGWGYGGGWGHGRWGGAYPVVYNGGEIRRCRIVEQVDAYGEVVGSRRVCRTQY